MNSGGQPTKLTPERSERILDDIKNAIPYELAAQSNGICEDTLYEWLKRGKQDREAGVESIYSRFSEDLKRVEKNRMRSHLDKIDANVDRWQADAWILERRWWKYFSNNAPLVEFEKRLERIENGAKENAGK